MGINIETTEYLLKNNKDPKSLIAMILSSEAPTVEFVNTFYDYITPEIFTKAYRLDEKLVEAFPELFDHDIFIEYITPYFKLDEEDNIKQNPNISLSLLNKYYNEITKDTDHAIGNILYIIRNEPKENINFNNCFNIVGISEKIDDLLMLRMPDYKREEMLLVMASNRSSTVTESICKYFSPDAAEMFIGNSCSSKDFVVFLAASKNLAWQKKKISDVGSGKIKLTKSKEDFSTNLVSLLSQLPEDLIVTLFNIPEIPSSYAVMKWVLNFKDFSEDQLINIKDIFKKAGLFVDLKNFAKAHEYSKLLEVL